MLDLFRLSGQPPLCPANDVVDLPPRAAGRQVHWSTERLMQLLAIAGRRPLDINSPCSPQRTAQERMLDSLMDALARQDEERALRVAEWLVVKNEAPRLVRWARPLAHLWTRAA